ncbi:uncharacterized protein ASPGLDRAFT_30336 [Aspergillus glaucus CBS 516.65]|uniref:Uncharacterized protein n=1 Tax=Aspergillus glaucus CBS 516.65 TaxID=1160497 RepID=A0A1L9V4Q6_ASPGL|nr:hypothetical protein ASPGLDRAFT_30336 [Aspergillus glaucus CBS 516.65]OJJ78839.1 hypothetical protein ASPGLDRAFT_30336 [Aspergillus glaucus CBS 516.65]
MKRGEATSDNVGGGRVIESIEHPWPKNDNGDYGNDVDQVTEDDESDISGYAENPVILYMGENSYAVPLYVVESEKALLPRLQTFHHGRFQFRFIELERVYEDVRQFGFEGLVEALKRVIDLASEVYPFQIIDIVLEGWHILKCDDKYTSHLEGTIMGVFREDSDLFKTDWFMDYFNLYVGSDQGLRKFLAQTMERAYSRKLLELRSRGEVERDVIEEPPCEKHLAKRRRRK